MILNDLDDRERYRRFSSALFLLCLCIAVFFLLATESPALELVPPHLVFALYFAAAAASPIRRGTVSEDHPGSVVARQGDHRTARFIS